MIQSTASYGLSFQENGYMNDDSVLVWAKLKNELPELVTFSICTWVKFTYEVRYCTILLAKSQSNVFFIISENLQPDLVLLQ